MDLINQFVKFVILPTYLLLNLFSQVLNFSVSMNSVDKLMDIWKNIPSSLDLSMDFTQKEIVKEHLDTFHISDYFYVIFNTKTAEMEYISPEIERIIGYTPSEFSIKALIKNLHPDDLPYYYHYEKSAVEFFTNLNKEEFFNYKFSYDYRILHKNGEYKRLLQQVIPIFYFPEGGARTLAILTDIDHFGITGIPKLSFIGKDPSPSYFNYHLKKGFEKKNQIFTNREKEILTEVIKGERSAQIARKLNLSIFTVQTHRKNILKKSGCTNLQELISKAIREGWV